MNGCFTFIKQRQYVLILWLTPLALHASFIESTQGTAVINDATAAYHNPAALTLFAHPQLVLLDSIATLNNHFNGQTTQSLTRFVQSGVANSTTHYQLPSIYLAKPINDRFRAGLAILGNDFGRDLDQHSILRYDQSSNQVRGIDFVPAVGYKINNFISIGAGLNVSYADFILKPIIGFQSLNIPDSPSLNTSKASGFGGDVGFILKPTKATTMGFNYRNAMTYRFHGKSIYQGTPEVISTHYGFKFYTPARSVASINQFLTTSLGVIGTVQYIQWDIFKTINLKDVAAPNGIQSAAASYYLHNSWLYTVGGHYRIHEKCVIRIAGTYSKSPGNAHYQITQGDNMIVGGSLGYDINQAFSIDVGYAHGFLQHQPINVTSGRNLVSGMNTGSRDGFSLKLTFTPHKKNMR